MVVGVDIVMLLIVGHKSDGTELATMSLRNRKVSQQEHGRSKSDKNLKTYQVEHLMGFWPCEVRRLRRPTRPTENKVTAIFGEFD